MASQDEYFELKDQSLILKGLWTIDNAEKIVKSLSDYSEKVTDIDARSVEKMDSWGAYYLKKIVAETKAGIQITDQQKKLLDFLPERKARVEAEKSPAALTQGVEKIGEKTLGAVQQIFGVISFIGQTSIRFVKNFSNPGSFRFHSIVRHIEETGVQALPIIALLAILTTMVISYQAATQLQKFGANIFTIDLTVISLLREMGVLITAIMVAGRSGSAFAAEIGVMKLREEVDALRTIGMDPFEVLVLPRVLALMITLPILTFVADMVGLAGGSIISMALLDIPLDQYIDRVQSVAKPTMFFVGMIKAPVFAFIIATIGTYQGMNISGSAESVGKLTTVSVVQAIFLVIMADAIFSIVFANMGV